jgi:DNA-binding MarR family transcriptional regulator
MTLRERLKAEVLIQLYQKSGLSISALSDAVGVRWETIERIVNQLVKERLVIMTKKETFPFEKVVNLTERGKKVAAEMALEDRGKLGVSERLLLAILYAVGGEVKGATKLEKLIFLLQEELGVPIKDFFKYFAYLHGPYSPDVMKSSYILAYYGFIDVNEEVYVQEIEGEKERVLRVFRLKEGKGEDFARELFESLPKEIKEKLERLRRFNNMTTRELLDYVYAKYPKFAKKYTKLDRWLA